MSNQILGRKPRYCSVLNTKEQFLSKEGAAKGIGWCQDFKQETDQLPGIFSPLNVNCTHSWRSSQVNGNYKSWIIIGWVVHRNWENITKFTIPCWSIYKWRERERAAVKMGHGIHQIHQHFVSDIVLKIKRKSLNIQWGINKVRDKISNKIWRKNLDIKVEGYFFWPDLVKWSMTSWKCRGLSKCDVWILKKILCS